MSDSDGSGEKTADETNAPTNSSQVVENNEDLSKDSLKRHKEDSTEEEPSSKRKKELIEKRAEPKSEVNQYKPAIKPFKIFILTLDDFISEEDAVETYRTYKFEHRKKYINNFFDEHKDEEWLMNLYHPDFKDRYKENIQKKLKGRLDIFLDLFEKGYVDGQTVQINNSSGVQNLFDAVMIKLSGGSDDDLPSIDPNNQDSGEPKEEDESLLIKGLKDEIFSYEALCIRNLPPSADPAKLEEECRSKEGFLRFSITSPNMEKKLCRTAWATYKSDVPIKKYCWELNSCSLIRNELLPISKELSVSVHRPSSQRILPVNSLTMHKDVMLADLKSAATLVAKLDEKYDLWGQTSGDHIDDDGNIDSNNSEEIPWMKGTFTSNPLMKSVNEYMTQEVCQDLNTVDDRTMSLSFDSNISRVLDLLIFYLRIVHSYDYYSATFYHDEDNMPHKCSLIHGRGDRSISFDDKDNPTMVFKAKDMVDYINNFQKKIDQVISQEFSCDDEKEYLSLGPRDIEEEKKKFIESNILKKISKKKPFKVVWMCPFSEKKFREPIYVEKHILNKHNDKIEAVMKEVQYFNNYLKNSNRPCQPDPPRYVVEQAFSKEFSRFGDNKGSGYKNLPSPKSGGRFARRSNNGRFNFDSEKNQQQALAAVSAVAANINSHNPAEILQKALYMMNNGNNQRNHYHPYRQNYNNQNRRGRDFVNRPKPSGKDRRMVSYNDLDNPNTDEI